jgi:Spy/CpxP family protein refolding chaperone
MRTTIMILLCAVFWSITAAAQSREGMGNRFSRPMERLERYKKIRMVEVLGLEDETGVKLVSRYSKHRERMKELEQERSKLIEKLETYTAAATGDSEYQKAFNEIYEMEKKFAEARKKYLEELKEILTNKQVAEYIIFERDFMKDVRDVVKDVQKERQRR